MSSLWRLFSEWGLFPSNIGFGRFVFPVWFGDWEEDFIFNTCPTTKWIPVISGKSLALEHFTTLGCLWGATMNQNTQTWIPQCLGFGKNKPVFSDSCDPGIPPKFTTSWQNKYLEKTTFFLRIDRFFQVFFASFLFGEVVYLCVYWGVSLQ